MLKITDVKLSKNTVATGEKIYDFCTDPGNG